MENTKEQVLSEFKPFFFFYKKIRLLSRREGWSKHADGDKFSIKFSSVNFGFNHAALKKVKRMFGLMGWTLNLMYYAANKEGYKYEFDLVKNKE